MATVAAVGAAAATTAAAAYSASGGGGGKGGGGGPSGPAAASLRERLFNRGTRDILNEERSMLEQALLEGNLVSDEMYHALGLEPIYDTDASPDIAGAASRANALRNRENEIRNRVQELKTLRGPGKKARQKELRQLKRERKNVLMQSATAEEELGRMSAAPRRIIGFKKLDGIADPTGSAGGAFGAALDQYNAGLSRALTGQEPIDPTLKREYLERENLLREKLRRQLGPDYETTTAGANALANFDREKTEAFAQYNRTSIDFYDKLSTGRAASLAGLTSARMKNLAFTPSFKASLGQTLEGLAGQRTNLGKLYQDERFGQARGEAEAAQVGYQAPRQTNDALATVLSGVGSAGGTLSTYLGQRGSLSGSLSGMNASVALGAAGVD